MFPSVLSLPTVGALSTKQNSTPLRNGAPCGLVFATVVVPAVIFHHFHYIGGLSVASRLMFLSFLPNINRFECVREPTLAGVGVKPVMQKSELQCGSIGLHAPILAADDAAEQHIALH